MEEPNSSTNMLARDRRNTPVPQRSHHSISSSFRESLPSMTTTLKLDSNKRKKFVSSSTDIDMDLFDVTDTNDVSKLQNGEAVDDTEDDTETEEEEQQYFPKKNQTNCAIHVLEETEAESMLRWARNQLSTLHREMINFLQMSQTQVKEWEKNHLPSLETNLNELFKKQLDTELFLSLHQWKYFALRRAIDEEFRLQSTKQFKRFIFMV